MPFTVLSFRRFLHAQLSEILPVEERRAHESLLLEHVLGVSLHEAILSPNKPVSDALFDAAERLIAELRAGRPVQYVLGYAYFYDRRFVVDASTLIPRRETEELCARALCRVRETGANGVRALDLGTGSGCIAVTLALEASGLEVYGIDLSEAALQVARENALRHGAAVNFARADILDAEMEGVRGADFALLVSNPPYIPVSEREEMSARVVDWEPDDALYVPDHDPLLFYRALGHHGLHLLRPGGWLLCEVHERFGDKVVELFSSLGFQEVSLLDDAQGRPRIVEGCVGKILDSSKSFNCHKSER